MSEPMRTQRVAVATGGAAAAVALATGTIVTLEGDGGRVGYRDLVGVATSCYGHTGPDVVIGRKYTVSECRAQLTSDVGRHTDAIRKCIRVALPTESFAAFISFGYNVGPAAFCKSTVARKLNAGDLRGACAGLSAWTYAKGRYVQGLANRRAQERALCERGLR